ncbi:hypothetical protein LUZ60_008825 [Juncus effusus]|nr:hypothetical protein LUZ60_008825 [Juncus effusus]
MMKKLKRQPLMEPSPSSSFYHGGDASFKYQNLFQEYHELQKETEAKRKKLVKAKQRKLKLEAEIKFLSRKYKKLSENPSQMTWYRLKRQPVPNGETSFQIKSNRISIRERKEKEERDFSRGSSGLIDLNQSCYPVGDEMDEFHVVNEPARGDKLKNYYVENEVSVCREGKGKRKITWQENVALRV